MKNRTRTRGNLATGLSAYAESIWTSCAETAWTNRTGNLTCMKVGKSETMSDVVVPGYHKRVQAGEVFFNGMSRTVIDSQSLGGSGHRIRAEGMGNCGGQNVQAEWNFLGDWFPRLIAGPSNTAPIIKTISDSDIISMEREVTAAVLNQRGRADFNISEALAERQKASAMLLDLIRRANPYQVLTPRNRARLLGHMKKVGTSPARMAKIAADDYLMYRYGIKPLVNDIGNILKAWRDPSAKSAPVRHTSRKSLTLNKTQTLNKSVSADACTTQYVQYCTDTVVVRAMSLDEFSHGVLRDFGLTFKDFVTTPWELVPYSFVADWFFNVGNIIGALTPSPGWKQLGSCLTIQRTVVTDSLATTSSSAGTGYTLLRPRSGGTHGMLFERTRKDLRDDFYVPVVKSNFGFKRPERVADAAALVGQLILRRFGVK